MIGDLGHVGHVGLELHGEGPAAADGSAAEATVAHTAGHTSTRPHGHTRATAAPVQQIGFGQDQLVVWLELVLRKISSPSSDH